MNDYDFEAGFWHPGDDEVSPTTINDPRYPNPWADLGDKPEYFNWLTCVDFDKIYRNTKSYTDEDYPWYTGTVDLVDGIEDCSGASLAGVNDEVLVDFEVCPERPEDELLWLIDKVSRYNPGARRLLCFCACITGRSRRW